MKFKVYKEEEKGEKTVCLKLEGTGNQIDLIAVDEHGNRIACGRLLSINSEGFFIHRNVNKDIGLPLLNGGNVKYMVSYTVSKDV